MTEEQKKEFVQRMQNFFKGAPHAIASKVCKSEEEKTIARLQGFVEGPTDPDVWVMWSHR